MQKFTLKIYLTAYMKRVIEKISAIMGTHTLYAIKNDTWFCQGDNLLDAWWNRIGGQKWEQKSWNLVIF